MNSRLSIRITWVGGACQTSLLLSSPRISASVALGWVLRICISNKFMGVAWASWATGLETTF